jgi:hypothetical protein
MWCFPLVILKHWLHRFSRAPPDSPTNDIKVVVRLGRRVRVNPSIGTNIGCENSHLGGDCWVLSVRG